MKILLASGIFPPDIGGPAIHTEKLADYFAALGWEVRVVTYTSGVELRALPFAVRRIPRKAPKLLRLAFYFFYALKEAIGTDLIYAHDPTAAGYPALLVARLLGKKLVVRIGGDALWERVLEKGERFVALKEYYESGFYKTDQSRLRRTVAKVLRRADAVVAPTELLKNLYEKFYSVPAAKIIVVPNPVPAKVDRAAEEATTEEATKKFIILFAGRLVAYKNLAQVIKVFDRVRQKTKKGELYLVGAGPEKARLEEQIRNSPARDHIKILPPRSRAEIDALISKSAVGLGPALTEFNPNFVLECLAQGRPVLVSRENGLAVKIPAEFLFDPKNGAALEEKLLNLMNEESYAIARRRVAALEMNWGWQDVFSEHRRLFEKLVGKA